MSVNRERAQFTHLRSDQLFDPAAVLCNLSDRMAVLVIHVLYDERRAKVSNVSESWKCSIPTTYRNCRMVAAE